jgi:ATP-dependent protease Clp ATPase subunit
MVDALAQEQHRQGAEDRAARTAREGKALISGRTGKLASHCMTPSQIVKFLDQHVVGQEEAKRQLAVAVYTHYRKIELAAPEKLEIIKSNVLLIGPTGTGKTLLCETLSRVLGVPFVTANATSLAQSEYVNDEIVAILERLIDKAEGDIGRAQRGIVFIDEIDKLKVNEGAAGRARHLGRRRAARAAEDHGRRAGQDQGCAYIDTTQILFICGGAFVGIDDILAQDPHSSASSRPRRTTTRSCSTASTPRQADRPVRVRPDPGIRRPPAHRRLAEAAVARNDGAHHDRAEELDLRAVPPDTADSTAWNW